MLWSLWAMRKGYPKPIKSWSLAHTGKVAPQVISLGTLVIVEGFGFLSSSFFGQEGLDFLTYVTLHMLMLQHTNHA